MHRAFNVTDHCRIAHERQAIVSLPDTALGPRFRGDDGTPLRTDRLTAKFILL